MKTRRAQRIEKVFVPDERRGRVERLASPRAGHEWRIQSERASGRKGMKREQVLAGAYGMRNERTE